MRHRVWRGQMVVAVWFAVAAAGMAAAEPSMPPAAADWLIPKVCADQADHPVGADPYAGCPDGSRLRPLRPGDPLPYRRTDQLEQQLKDVYPRTAADGAPVVIATFDWHDPHNGDTARFKLQADGYDTYVAAGGWASVIETRMGTGEYGTSFVAGGCRHDLGQLFFPLPPPDAEHPSGVTTHPEASLQWEEDAQAFPGDCPSRYVGDELFTWKLVRDFPFGGIGGAPRRPLDSIITTVGLRTVKDPQVIKRWMSYGHLESFYFTRLYGVSRWESWIPEEQFQHGGREPAAQAQQRAASAARVCGAGPGMSLLPFTLNGQPAQRITMQYQSLLFTMNDCRDWSRVLVQETPAQPPAWPVSALNLLRNFHFNGSAGSLDGWIGSRLAHADIRVSSSSGDTTRDTPAPLRGVVYLRWDCGGGCAADALVQDIPLSAGTPVGSYTLGVIARTEAGAGVLELSLSQLDAAGKTLSTATFRADLTAQQTSCDSAGKHCKTYTFDPVANTGTVELSSAFVSRALPLSIDPRARVLRYAVVPKSDSVFDLVSVWLMRSP